MRWRVAIVVALAGCSVKSSSIEQASTPQCATQKVEGLDVYAGDGTIDWAQVKASGRDFAFMKATQGDYNKQATFVANWSQSAAAGVQRSAYHFFDPTIDGTAQAQWFLDELALAGGMTDGDLPPMLDIECPVSSNQGTATSSGPNCEYTGNSGWVATATMQQRIFDWLDAVEAATGRKPLVYSYPAWFASVQFTDPRLADYPLFIATYSTCASVPAPFTAAIFWQYSASATVPGVPAAAVDVDRFFGSAGDLQTWNASTVTPPDAGVPPDADGDAGGDAGLAGNNAAGGGCGCGVDVRDTAGLFAGVVVIAALLRRKRKRRRTRRRRR